MPDGRLQRTREALPPRYQFGDARFGWWTEEQIARVKRRGAELFQQWRAPHENAAEQLQRRVRSVDCDPADCDGV